MDSEWALFKASIAEAAATSCGWKVVGVYHGGNPRARWHTPAVREAVRQKKEAFRVWLACGSPDSAEGYQQARWSRMQKLRCGRRLEKPWRRTFGWPQRGSDKPSVG